MLQKLSHLQREKSEQGFTLIELLVVILIIGILAAIAIPAFMNQRKAAVDASLESDLGNVAREITTGQITNSGDLAVDKQSITSDGVAPLAFVEAPLAFMLPTDIIASKGNIIQTYGLSDGSFCLIGVNPAGDKAAKGMTYDSKSGGLGTGDGACTELGTVHGTTVEAEVSKMLAKPGAGGSGNSATGNFTASFNQTTGSNTGSGTITIDKKTSSVSGTWNPDAGFDNGANIQIGVNILTKDGKTVQDDIVSWQEGNKRIWEWMYGSPSTSLSDAKSVSVYGTW